MSRTAAQKESDLILSGTFGKGCLPRLLDRKWISYEELLFVSMELIPPN